MTLRAHALHPLCCPLSPGRGAVLRPESDCFDRSRRNDPDKGMWITSTMFPSGIHKMVIWRCG
ncbi:hypothetical protein FM103_09325 [Corynebacterium xerosis]|nr:hypothetical protein FM103_09325 [Corynebacterium xerosis]